MLASLSYEPTALVAEQIKLTMTGIVVLGQIGTISIFALTESTEGIVLGAVTMVALALLASLTRLFKLLIKFMELWVEKRIKDLAGQKGIELDDD